MELLVSHPQRAQVVSEMHLRRMPGLTAPSRMTQTVKMVAADCRERELAHIIAMPGVAPELFVLKSRSVTGRAVDGLEMLWERHSEASTITVIEPGKLHDAPVGNAAAALDWLEGSPGEAIRATQILIVGDELVAEHLLGSLDFIEADLVSCRIGGARIWTDFQLREDGYGRLIIAAGDTPPSDLGRTVQRLQELGNYRNLALLGLPLAQTEAQRLADVERQIEDIIRGIAEAPDGDEAVLLDKLCDIAAAVTAMSTATSFRMSATEAYAQIAYDRLSSLQSTEISGFQSLQDFTDRRLLPAVRTCASFVQRLEALAIQIERATSLLRTKVDLAMQISNAGLLRSMDGNTARQVKLQHLVEGLSVIAISYYSFSLLEKLIPLAGSLSGFSEMWIQSVLLPLVIAVIYFSLRHRGRDLH